MKWRTKLLIAVMAIAMVGGLGWLIFGSHEPAEPVYQEKQLSEWLSLGPYRSDPSHDGTQNASAEQAVRQIGTNGIPTLLRMLRAKDSKLKLALIGLARKQQLIKIHFVTALRLNQGAEFGFQILGEAASNAVPALIKILEEGVSPQSQISTAEVLDHIGPAAGAAVPALLRTATNTNADAELRVLAERTLMDIGANPELVVPTLIKCLKDSEPSLRLWAAGTLMLVGTEAKAAVPALVELLKDPDADVRGQAETTLKIIDPEAAEKAGVK